MARINIDDELHADHRFKRLVRKLGNEDLATGMLYRFWRIAQDFWANGELLPKSEFDAEDFQVLLDVGLAEERPEGIYAKGSEQRFGWYVQRCRASEAKAKKAPETKPGVPELNSGPPESDSGHPETNSGAPESISGPPNATATVPSTVPAPVKKIKKDPSGGAALSSATNSQNFIAHMVERYQAKYHTRPILDGPTQGAVKRLLKFVPLQQARDLYEVYLQIDDDWFRKKRHDFATFMANLQTVAVALGTGEKSAPTDWEFVFGEVANDSGSLQIANGQA